MEKRSDALPWRDIGNDLPPSILRLQPSSLAAAAQNYRSMLLRIDVRREQMMRDIAGAVLA